MGKYWRMMGDYNAESTTYSALAGTVSSPYIPDENAKLVALRSIPNQDAASTLMNHVQFKLTCTKFKPNSIEAGGQGSGLRTAPALGEGPMDWPVDQEVQAGVPITIEARNITADTPVGVRMSLYGLFQS